MKAVTITLNDVIANRVNAEAASQGKSVSEFVSELIEREIERKDKDEPKEMTDLEAIQDFLSGQGIPATGIERLPTRQEIYDERIDELVRRYEHSNLLDR